MALRSDATPPQQIPQESTTCVDESTQQEWIKQLRADFPVLNAPGYAEALVAKFCEDPAWFEPENLDALMKQFAGKAQEMRGEALPGSIQVLRGEESEKFWKEREEKLAAENKLEAVPIGDGGDSELESFAKRVTDLNVLTDSEADTSESGED